MHTVRHKLFGQGTVINKEPKGIGSYITVRFDMSGKESRFAIPESFETGLLIADGALLDEITAAIAAKREAERAAREMRAAKTFATTHAHRTSSGNMWNTTVTAADGSVRDAYERYLLYFKKYKELTPCGSDSTVPQYMRAVESVLEEEHLTWSALESQLPHIISLYDKGGAKETLGNRSNRTWINALKRFADFC